MTEMPVGAGLQAFGFALGSVTFDFPGHVIIGMGAAIEQEADDSDHGAEDQAVGDKIPGKEHQIAKEDIECPDQGDPGNGKNHGRPDRTRLGFDRAFDGLWIFQGIDMDRSYPQHEVFGTLCIGLVIEPFVFLPVVLHDAGPSFHRRSKGNMLLLTV